MLSVFVFLQSLAGRAAERLSAEEKGATATEYSLLVGLIALGVIAGVTAFGSALNGFFYEITSTVKGW